MIKKLLSALLLCAALFSGQTGAQRNGHTFYKVQSPDALLRHSGDSDEIRSAAEEAALDIREHHHWSKSRKPGMHQN
ncbi:DUF2554 family protein [Atlantibacter sp.]|uniref:DUF2554 family protein n=1 Tax=Atlantibacter sp. TaxID=1903473 RepID=UPI002898E8DC|nr:DUF2554 family protein [Atlantibacter sp.]